MDYILASTVTILILAVIGFLNYQAWKPSPPYMEDVIAEWLFRIIAGSVSVILVCGIWMLWCRAF